MSQGLGRKKSVRIFPNGVRIFPNGVSIFQTAFVFACSYKGSAKNRLVATDNRLLISLFGVKVAHVARFFEFITRARKKMPAVLRRISVNET